jgi:hypothetical protein
MFLFEQELSMPRFVLEREMPAVASSRTRNFQGAAEKSCDVLRAMGPEGQCIPSDATGDKIRCVYHASDGKLIREHAERSGIPANKISNVSG